MQSEKEKYSVEADCSTSEPQLEENNVQKDRNRGNFLRGRSRKIPFRNKDRHPPNFSRDDNYINERLSLFSGSTADLQEIRQKEHKFSSRSRLFVANLPPKTTEEELLALFKPFGETNDMFINEAKNFAFVKFDYHINAERAKDELTGTNLRGKEILVKFAHLNGVIVKNLPPFVSNELLYHAFSIFGDIERCYILLDENRKSKNEGVVEYAMKSSAMLAIKRCTENYYFITASLKPLIVESYDVNPDCDGLPESAIRKTAAYYRSRDLPPRFAKPSTFEHEYAQRWRQLNTKYKEILAKVNAEQLFEEQKLEEEMRRAQFDYETERLKEMVRQREMESKHFKQDWGEMRPNTESNKENDLVRLRQPDSLFIQANQLTNLLDREEQLQEQWSRTNIFSSRNHLKTNQPWLQEGDGPNFKRMKHSHR